MTFCEDLALPFQAAGLSLSRLGGFGICYLLPRYCSGMLSRPKRPSRIGAQAELEQPVVALDNDAVGDEGCSLLQGFGSAAHRGGLGATFSISSRARTGTRSSLPTLTVGMTPFFAAA